MADAALQRPLGSIVADKYRLVRVIGRGGMGVVYEATHAITQRPVAIKVLHAQHRRSAATTRRFLNEARAAGRIVHPNVVEVYDAGEDSDGSLYLVLELLAGEDLAARLVRQRRLEVRETVTIVAQVLQALVVAHHSGVIHRDIKPENVFLTRALSGETHVKLLDFGISKTFGPAQAPSAFGTTQAHIAVGTPHYMAPEQASAELAIDPRADVWAVGVVTYECLAGCVPVAPGSAGPHAPLANFDVPLELSRIVDRALQRDRELRYAGTAEMLADLRGFIDRHREYATIPPHLLRAPHLSILPPSRAPGGAWEAAVDPALALLADAPATVVDQDPGRVFGDDIATVVQRAETAVPLLPDSRGRRGRYIAAIGVAIALGAAAAIATSLRAGRSANPPATPAARSVVAIRFVGLGPDARVVIDGAPVASELVQVPRSSTPLHVEVAAPGRVPAAFVLVPTSDLVVPVPMLPLPPLPPAAGTHAEPPPAQPRIVPQPMSASEPLRRSSVPRTGRIAVRATPACAEIAVDGAPRGPSPVEVAGLEPGDHRVVCQLATGALRTRYVGLAAGDQTVIEFNP